MEEARRFPFIDVLAVARDCVLSLDQSGVQAVLNYMTAEQVYDHQKPRILGEAREVLLRQHPELAEVDLAGINASNVAVRMEVAQAQYGNSLTVVPMTADEHEHREPISEMVERMHPERIISIEKPKGRGPGMTP